MSLLSEHLKQVFIKALEHVSQRVLWKYEEKMVDQPKNLMIKIWLSQ